MCWSCRDRDRWPGPATDPPRCGRAGPQGRRAGGRQDRWYPGRQTDPGAGPALPPDRAALGRRRGGGARRRGPYRGHDADRRPDRRRDGGADRGGGRRPGAGGHGEGDRPGRGDQRHQGRGEVRRQDRALDQAMIRALAIPISSRAAAGVYEDRSGPVLAGLLREAGCAVDGPTVIPDGDAVEGTLRDAVGAGYDVVVTTGGTGLTPGDLTP